MRREPGMVAIVRSLGTTVHVLVAANFALVISLLQPCESYSTPTPSAKAHNLFPTQCIYQELLPTSADETSFVFFQRICSQN